MKMPLWKENMIPYKYINYGKTHLSSTQVLELVFLLWTLVLNYGRSGPGFYNGSGQYIIS